MWCILLLNVAMGLHSVGGDRQSRLGGTHSGADSSLKRGRMMCLESGVVGIAHVVMCVWKGGGGGDPMD